MMQENKEARVPRSGRRWALIVGGVVLVTIAGVVWVRRSPPGNDTGPVSTVNHDPQVDVEHLRPQVIQFCGACHEVPSPSYFSKADWPKEVALGYSFYERSQRTDLKVPPQLAVVDFFSQQAPDELMTVEDDLVLSSSPVRFHRRDVPLIREKTSPMVTHVTWLPSSGTDEAALMLCGMHSGVHSLNPSHPADAQALGSFFHPDHVTPTDLDGDGQRDFVVCELGSFLPEDHDRGRVLWLHRQPASGEWETVVLQDQLGRVADAQPADVDGDGDVDLIVAEFGWRSTGHILLLENEGLTDGKPRFRKQILDDRHGTIHVPVADLNGDGRPDFVAVISQEFETIVAFLNLGDGKFQRQTIMTPRDPAYGSSGIQLVDFDRDGDLDVLYTNGDSFDSNIVKPYHGVQWLENRGEYPFKLHPIAKMPGVHRALAGDIDGDGDLDFAAVAFLPPVAAKNKSADTALAAVAWYEQTQPGEFVRHVLKGHTCHHPTCDLADIDGDGDLDLIVGQFVKDPIDVEPWFTIWVNEGKQ
jgi:hypothetical protein